jgi:hypothetical protein
LDDFGNPTTGSPDAPLPWEVLKFDAKGRLVEDVDLERPLIEQESYRYVYTYNPRGLLVEKAGYREDSSSDGKSVYSYGPGGRKIEELIYSGDGRIQARKEFDEHENFTSVEWYRDDGSVRQKENHRYEYVTKGNTLEQIYYPPQRQPGSAGFTFHAPLGVDTEESAKIVTPARYRTVFVRDDAGHVREESRYDVDGSLLEKKICDQKGILRNKEWRLGEATVTTTVFDDQGREIESHTIAKQGFGSPRAVDNRTLFSYDGHGNLTEMTTSGPDGSLVQGTTNVFE